MNSRFPTPLLDAIRLAATEIPFEVLLQIANGLCSASTESIEDVRREVTKTLGHSSFRRQMTLVLDEWGKCADRSSSESVGAALLSAAHLEVHRRNTEALELIWTGPTSPGISLRRTDQALLGLVSSARSRLTIVSFAVYKAGSILHAIGEAIRRGVVVRIVLESHEESEGRLAFDTIKEIGDELAIGGGIFVWPLDRRERDASDRIGVLHAKCAIADGKQLFISSANLTSDALSMNMELGVMIGGGPLPSTAEDHLSRLIELGRSSCGCRSRSSCRRLWNARHGRSLAGGISTISTNTRGIDSGSSLRSMIDSSKNSFCGCGRPASPTSTSSRSRSLITRIHRF